MLFVSTIWCSPWAATLEYVFRARLTIREFWFEEVVFADDLNAFRIVPSSTSAGTAMNSVVYVQCELHKGGDANRVGFDVPKGSNHVHSLNDPLGPELKLLGVTFDCKLETENAVRSLTGKVKWKLQMLLRSRRSFHTTDLVIQYEQ